MKYILINRTKISNKKIRQFIQHSWPKGLKKCRIILSYEYGDYEWRGDAKQFSKNKIKTIRIFIQKNKIKFPRMINNTSTVWAGYSPIFIIRNKDEVLVSLIAHELRHIWQTEVSKINFLRSRICEFIDSTGENRISLYKMEKDACSFSKRKLLQWRKSTKI